MSAIEVNETNFQHEVLNSESPVLVDFWAEWCGPCKALGPIVHELAKDFAPDVKVVKVNIDNAPALAQKYEILSIPTLAIFKNGIVADKKIGLYSKAILSNWLTSHK